MIASLWFWFLGSAGARDPRDRPAVRVGRLADYAVIARHTRAFARDHRETFAPWRPRGDRPVLCDIEYDGPYGQILRMVAELTIAAERGLCACLHDVTPHINQATPRFRPVCDVFDCDSPIVKDHGCGMAPFRGPDAAPDREVLFCDTRHPKPCLEKARARRLPVVVTSKNHLAWVRPAAVHRLAARVLRREPPRASARERALLAASACLHVRTADETRHEAMTSGTRVAAADPARRHVNYLVRKPCDATNRTMGAYAAAAVRAVYAAAPGPPPTIYLMTQSPELVAIFRRAAAAPVRGLADFPAAAAAPDAAAADQALCAACARAYAACESQFSAVVGLLRGEPIRVLDF